MTLVRHRTLWVALGVQPEKAQHSPAEGDGLTRWAAGRRRLVEIGVADGASANRLRSAMEPSGDLWFVDPSNLSRNPLFNTGLVAARGTVKSGSGCRVHFVVQESLEAAAGWQQPLDFVFVDADHDYQAVLADWRAWSRHVDSNGVVAFHDAIRAPGHLDGSARVVDDLFRGRVREPSWRMVDEVETLVVLEKTS